LTNCTHFNEVPEQRQRAPDNGGIKLTGVYDKSSWLTEYGVMETFRTASIANIKAP